MAAGGRPARHPHRAGHRLAGGHRAHRRDQVHSPGDLRRASRTPGPCALAGLRITFRAGRHTGSVATYDDGLVAWFYRLNQPNQAQFTRLFNAAAGAQNALASS